MFELMMHRAGSTLVTTRMLSRKIYRIVRKEQKLHLLEKGDEILKKEHADEASGMVDTVDKDMEELITVIQKGEVLNEKLEKHLTLFLFRYFREIEDDIEKFNRLHRQLLAIFSQGPTVEEINEIIKYFKDEHEVIHKELLLFARMMRDQSNKNARLRDEILLVVMKDMKERQKARRLRRVLRSAQKTEKAITHDETELHHHLKTLGKFANDPKKKTHELEAIQKAVEHLALDLKKDDSILKQMTASVEFIMKMAVAFFFNLSDEEGKLIAVEKHLQSLKYPQSHLAAIEKERKKLDDYVDEHMKNRMHEMYQLLHREDAETKV